MKKLIVIKTTDIVKVMNCFVDHEELQDFYNQLMTLVSEIEQTHDKMMRVDESSSLLLLAKQLFVMSIFCKENIEIIKQLIGEVKYQEITEEEKHLIVDGIDFDDGDIDDETLV